MRRVVASSVDVTGIHKEHFLTLDGLRGVAAFSVVLWHTSQVFGGRGWQPHALLAVDFFFMLSGFVVSYNYDARLTTGRLTPLRFAKLRAVRLYPWLFSARR